MNRLMKIQNRTALVSVRGSDDWLLYYQEPMWPKYQLFFHQWIVGNSAARCHRECQKLLFGLEINGIWYEDEKWCNYSYTYMAAGNGLLCSSDKNEKMPDYSWALMLLLVPNVANDGNCETWQQWPLGKLNKQMCSVIDIKIVRVDQSCATFNADKTETRRMA